MRLLKTKEYILPENWPNEILKNGQLQYFIRGKGYKKTKSFKILDDVMPDKWEKLSWLQIAKYSDQYGLEVGELYADSKVAGIVARQFANEHMIIYQVIKDIIPENFDERFFDCLRADYMCACFGMFVFDIIKTDENLGQIDPDYNPLDCTYITQSGNLINAISMRAYVLKKYGQVYADMIDKLIATTKIETNDQSEVLH